MKNEVVEKCKILLGCMGFEVDENAEKVLKFSVDETENYIKNFCNITKIPQGLFEVWVKRSCGSLITYLKDTGLIKNGNLDFSAAVKSITEGDVSVTYSGGVSGEDKINSLTEALKEYGKSELLRYRKIAW